jgi:thiol-disulfide isomerase/thioredoxin
MNRSLALTVLALTASAGLALAQEKAPAEKTVQPKAPAGEKQPDADKAAAPKLEVGMPAPALQIEKWVKGEPVTGFEKGKVYIVEYWATWCGPCMRSIPHLTELQKEFKDKGVTIIGVTSADKRGNTLEKVEKMVAEKGDTMNYRIAWDKERATTAAYLDAADAPGIPYAFVVDKAGKVAYIGNPLQFDLGLVLDRVLADKWDIKKGPDEIESMVEDAGEAITTIRQKVQTDAAGAWKDFQAFETKYPRIARSQSTMRADMMIRNNDAGAAKAAAEAVEKATAAKNYLELNEVAWAIVDPKGGARNKDLDLAMKAATEANKLSKEKNPAIIDTLARVYWLKNDKTKAVDLQKKAVELAGEDEDLKKELEDNLKEYQSGGKS